MRSTILLSLFLLNTTVFGQTHQTIHDYRWFSELKRLIETFKFDQADSLIHVTKMAATQSDTLAFAKLYHAEAHLALNRGKLDEAIHYLDSATLFYRYTDTIPIPELYEFYFASYQRKGQLSKAIEYLKLLLPLTNQPFNDTKTLQVLNNLILSFTDNENLDSASYYLALADSLIKHAKVSNYELILYWQWKANYYNALNLPSESSMAYQSALQLARDSLKNHPRLADILVEFGLLNSQTGNFETAVQQYSEANNIYRTIYGRPHPRMISPSINIANYYSRKGDLEKALSLYNEAEELIRALGSSYDRSLSMVDNNRGNCYNNAGRHEEAIDWYEKSLEARMAMQGENSGSVAQSRFNLANCLVQMHQDSLALPIFRQIRNWYLGLEDRQLQPKYLELCIAIANTFNHLNLMDSSAIYLSRADTLWNRMSTINQEFEREQYIQLQVAWSAYHQHLSGDKMRLSELNQAASALACAIEAISNKGITLEFEETIIDFYSDAYPIFEKAIDLQNQLFQIDQNQDHIENAFIYANLCKSISLQQAIRRSDAFIYKDISSAKLDTLTQLRIQLRKLQMKQSKWIDTGLTYKSDSVASLSSLINKAMSELGNFESELEENYPNYYKLKRLQKPIGSELISKKILQPGSCLLQYFIGDEKLFIFTLSDHQLRLYQSNLDFPLVQLVENFRSGVSDFFVKSVSEREDSLYIKCATRYADAASEIYRRIWAPVKDFLKPNVIIITDGILGGLPFDALLTSPPNRADRFKNLPYLIRTQNISYRITANLDFPNQSFFDSTSLDLVISPFDVANTEVASSLKSVVQPLKYSYEEAEKIHSILGGIWLEGKDATRENFMKYASQARILHIATHSQADLNQNDLSYLAFQSPDSQVVDALFAGDIYSLSLNADIVMLSACETGVGTYSRSEGMLSLARAFLQAGSKSVFSTLWKINDEKTSQMMVGFYQNLQRYDACDQAMREAKLKSIENAQENIDAHPFFWAAFVGIGEMSRLKKE